MALSADQLEEVRSWVGRTVENSVLQARYKRLASVDAVIEEELRSQIAELNESPTTLSLPGGLSVGFGQNLSSLQRTLSDFLARGGTDGISDAITPTFSKLKRPDYR